MIDIVELLRICAKYDPDQAQAADEIERLRELSNARGEQVKRLCAEIERLRQQLRYQEHRDGRIGTHDTVCYAYGPSHYECALREIERLREALRLMPETIVDAADEIERLREQRDRMATLAIDNAKDTERAFRFREALKKLDVGEGWAALVARAALKDTP